jgi:hypothetical protein
MPPIAPRTRVADQPPTCSPCSPSCSVFLVLNLNRGKLSVGKIPLHFRWLSGLQVLDVSASMHGPSQARSDLWLAKLFLAPLFLAWHMSTLPKLPHTCSASVPSPPATAIAAAASCCKQITPGPHHRNTALAMLTAARNHHLHRSALRRSMLTHLQSHSHAVLGATLGPHAATVCRSAGEVCRGRKRAAARQSQDKASSGGRRRWLEARKAPREGRR